jgi:ABC-type branched-subunit amino acid transport system substrate-binding protein
MKTIHARNFVVFTMLFCLFSFSNAIARQDTVWIALNYPESGPYVAQGLDQWRAAELARVEINKAGGILGKKVQFRLYDSKSNVKATEKNVTDAIDRGGVKMVFGGSSSAVAIAAGKICQAKKVPFFGTLTYSTTTTGEAAHRYTFRECYNAWMGAKAIGSYLKKNFGGKKFFYITADYTWGWTTEASLRKFTGTEDKTAHPGVRTPFPSSDFSKALRRAQRSKPQVLVLVLFGQEMANAVRRADAMGMKNDMQIVVPNLTLGMAERGTPKSMQGVIGALPWAWRVPYKYNFKKGIAFVKKFSKRFNRYPSTSGASAYTIMYEYKEAVERAGTFEPSAVVEALEGHTYQYLKDHQTWRKFDHQSVQTVYTVRCKPAEEVLKDRYQLDYFEIIGRISGDAAVRTRAEWNAVRKAAGKPTRLEALP